MNVLSEKWEKLYQGRGIEKNEGAILKFVNISSDAISPNEMHEVSSASTSKSLSEVEDEITPGQIRNNGEVDVERI